MASNYQMKFNGLTFGLGTDISIEVIDGFENYDVNVGDAGIPRAWGDVPGLHSVTSREVTLQLSARTDANLKIILDTFQPLDEPLPLHLTEPVHGERFVYARPIGRAFTRNATHQFKKMVSVRLKLADPRLYGAQEYGHTLSVYDGSGGGTEYPVTDYGKEFAGSPNSGEKVLVNAGNANAYPIVRFYGPPTGTVTAVSLLNATTGQELVLNTTILSSQTLTADMRRIVTVDPGSVPYISLNGATRYGDWELPREPFYLAPGDNFLRFSLTGTSTDALCVVNYRDTRL